MFLGSATRLFFAQNYLIGIESISVRLSENALHRLSWRYVTANGHKESIDDFIDEEIVTSVRDAIVQVMIANSALCRTTATTTSWTVSPSFYEMAAIIVNASSEFFSDVVNESGVLSTFCSLSAKDSLFGSCGLWENAIFQQC